MNYQRQTSIEELARKLKPLFGKKIDELYFRYVTAESLDEKNEITQLLTGLYQKNLNQLLEKGVLLEPPKEDLVSGEYKLGEVEYSNKKVGHFGLREKDWPRHMCITGMSGSGKTTFAFNILKSFIEKDKPFLVFDWKKSFRPLISLDNSLMCFTVGREEVSNSFKTNINRPPKGVSPKEWINTLCDLLTESFSASFGVHKILLETLDEAFESWGVYTGSELYPNWQHLKKILENKMSQAKGRESGWYESAMRIATVLTFGDFGKVVNYDGKKSLSIENLFNKRAIFELNSLSNIEKKFFCEYILTYIYKLKKAGTNKISEGFNYSILVDEAHNIFLKNPTNFLGESVTDMVYREMREYGTSLICLDQHISKLSDTVKGNSACHVAFQQQLPQDIEDVSSLMQLRDTKEMFSQLEIGNAIVKLSERHTKPFLIQAPFVDLRNISVTDEKIASRMDALISGIEMELYDQEFENKLHYTEVDPNFVETIPFYKKNFSESEELNIIGNESLEEINITNNRELDRLNIVNNSNLEKININSNDDLDEVNIYGNKELDKINIVGNKELDRVNISGNKCSGLLENPEIDEIKDGKPELGELQEVEIIESFSKTQEVLYDFAREKTKENMPMREIEKILDAGLSAGYYSSKDVLIVMNKIMKDKFQSVSVEEKVPKSENTNIELNQIGLKGKKEVIEIKEKPSELSRKEIERRINAPSAKVLEVRPEQVISVAQVDMKSLKEEEKSFVTFLIKNPEHKNTTVELYKLVGLSVRKGNVVKNELLKKGLISIEEKRNDRGWKKLIKLSSQFCS